MADTFVSFEVHTSDLTQVQVRRSALPALSSGEILLRIDTFALTANNVTYGVVGDAMGYWKFFPVDAPWGCLPVWGFGEVVASEHPELAAGERLYGYWPMASHAVLAPQAVGARSFVDGAAHRAALPALYNSYERCAADPGYQRNQESLQALFRPLFTTSFLLDDFLADNDFFGARSVVLTSASSKTAIGLAHQLSQRGDAIEVVGLTSASRTGFVQNLGCYGTVLAYDDVRQLPEEPAALVDIAGSAAVRARVHGFLGERLRYSASVGATHWEQTSIGAADHDLPGPAPTMFFAPAQAEKRLQTWGPARFAAAAAEAWSGFVPAAQRWFTVQHHQGEAAVRALYADLLAGRSDPSRGHIAAL